MGIPLDPALLERLRGWAAGRDIRWRDDAELVDRALREFLGAIGEAPGPPWDLPGGRGGFAMLDWSAMPPDAGGVRLHSPGPGLHDDEAERMLEKAYARAASRAFGVQVAPEEAMGVLAPPPVLREEPLILPPSAVPIGLRPGEAVAPADRVERLPFTRPDARAPLSGLTNRLAPTIWASTQLVRMVGRRGESVSALEFLGEIMPDAWRNGAGLKNWEDEERLALRMRPGQRRAGLPFHASARWPSLSGRVLREASSTVSFVSFSLGTWSPGRQQFDGPLAALGLVEVAAGLDGWWRLRPTAQAVRLAHELAHTSASCAYPHDDDAWPPLERLLADSPTGELGRMRLALKAFARARSTEGFERGIVEHVPSPTGRPLGAKALASEAGGHLARLKEMGLVMIRGPRFGPDAITERGALLLERGQAT